MREGQASRVSGEDVADDVHDGLAVLASGVEVAAERVPVPGRLLGPEPTGDLLLGLRGVQVALGVVRCRGYPQVSEEPEHVVFAVLQAFKEAAAGLLPGAPEDPADLR